MAKHQKSSWLAHRNRTLVKKTYFTQQEWENVETRIRQAQTVRPNMTWQEYSNRVTQGNTIRLIKLPYNPERLMVILKHLGANVNQIAHQANMQGGATGQQIRAACYAVDEAIGVTDQLISDWDNALHHQHRTVKRK